jgi:hypothetical protein
MLILIAMSFPAPKITKRAANDAKPSKTTSLPATRTATRRPYFALTEPLSASPPPPKPEARPRLRVIDFEQMALDRLNGVRRAPKPPINPNYNQQSERNAAPLIARISGLIDAIDNTGYHAARMARWLRSRQLQSYDLYNLPPRISPIRYGRPPDASRKRMGAEVYRNYIALNARAHDAVDLGYDDSS